MNSQKNLVLQVPNYEERVILNNPIELLSLNQSDLFENEGMSKSLTMNDTSFDHLQGKGKAVSERSYGSLAGYGPAEMCGGS